jgi:hypothetical protein
MDGLGELGTGMTMADVKTLETIQQWIEVFVDDAFACKYHVISGQTATPKNQPSRGHAAMGISLEA